MNEWFVYVFSFCLRHRPFFHVFKTHHLPCWFLGSTKQTSLENHNKTVIKNANLQALPTVSTYPHQKIRKLQGTYISQRVMLSKAWINPLRRIRCKFIGSYISKGHNGHLISVDKYILQNVVDAILNTSFPFNTSSSSSRQANFKNYWFILRQFT